MSICKIKVFKKEEKFNISITSSFLDNKGKIELKTKIKDLCTKYNILENKENILILDGKVEKNERDKRDIYLTVHKENIIKNKSEDKLVNFLNDFTELLKENVHIKKQEKLREL